MMPRPVRCGAPSLTVLALASGSSQAAHAVVRSIGSHQYMVTDAGKQVFAKANGTCAKLGRVMMPLGVQAGGSRSRPGEAVQV